MLLMSNELVFSKKFEIGWNHLDANAHVKNSMYAEFGDDTRVAFWQQNGVTPFMMHEMGIGPILFDSYIQFFKEITLGENIEVDLVLESVSEDYRKWKIVHHIYKKENMLLAAKITVNGSFINLITRKICPPTDILKGIFKKMPTFPLHKI